MTHSEQINRQWVLSAYPQGAVRAEDFQLAEAPVGEPGPGEILVRTTWLSVDPYLKGKMAAPAMALGEVVPGGGVGEVVASNHPAWKPGDLAEALNLGWQEYSVLKPGGAGAAAVNRILDSVPPQSSLGWLGMTGVTAYFAMLEVCLPKPGDTVVVSAAAGGVGQVAGQLAKLAGARVVGLAGSNRKSDLCRELGFDQMINYRDVDDLDAAIAAACPSGVHAFFDGTGGAVHDAVLRHLAVGARVAIVGRIAMAAGGEDVGQRASSLMIPARATIRGFMVFDWWHRREEAIARLSQLYADGKLKIVEDISEGFESVPDAFLRMMSGSNLGKQLVRI